MNARSYNDISLPIGATTHVLTDRSPAIGSQVNITNQDGNIVNIGKVLEVKNNPSFFSKRHTLVVEIIA